MSLLKDNEIVQLYKNKYDFNTAYQEAKDLKNVTNMFMYMVNRFQLGGGAIPKVEATNALDAYVANGHRDSSVYLYTRILRRENLLKVPTVSELRAIEDKAYLVTIKNKVDDLYSIITSKAGISPEELSRMSILDIGTEKLAFLDELQKRSPSGEVHGINIDTGFCHYDEGFCTNIADPRFKLYNGRNIPHPDKKFDLVTMYSVIHHISDEDLPIVAKEIARVCRGYLFFKDVNLIDESTKAMFRIQHHLYEGIMMPGERSYMNDTVTIDRTLKIFKDAGFDVVAVSETPNFNRSYYALLHVSGEKGPLPSEFIWERDIYTLDEIKDIYSHTWPRIDTALQSNLPTQIRHFQGEKWLKGYNNMNLTLVVDPNIERDAEIVTDYFVERERMSCNRSGFPSPIEFMRERPDVWGPIFLRKRYTSLKQKAVALKESIAEAMKYQLCAKFPWTVCKAVYEKFKARRILDMCAGWGDRLISAMAYGAEKYVGVDPNTSLGPRYQEMIDAFGNGAYRYIIKAFEDITSQDISPAEMFDLMFTSPPYFTAEQYSLNASQAYIRYPTLESWLKGFMFKSISIAWKHLERNGHFIFVINDTHEVKFVARVLQYISQQPGSRYQGMIKYVIKGTRITQPIWIFKRVN